MLTIVIVSFNTRVLLEDCLGSIFKTKCNNQFEVCVVDNNSIDGSPQMVRSKFPKVRLIMNDKNLGFAQANNIFLKEKKSEIYLLLNSDTKVLDGSLDNLVDFTRKNNFGITSCKVINNDRSLQPNAGDLPFLWPTLFWLWGWDDIFPFFGKKIPSFHRQSARYYQGEKEVGWVSGSVMMIKNEVLKKVGFLDDKIFMYGEDVDYCLRAKKNCFKIGWTERAEIVHLGGGSSKEPTLKQWVGEFKGLIYIYKKHFGNLAALLLKMNIYLFTIVRALAFLFLGKLKISKTYAKVIFDL